MWRHGYVVMQDGQGEVRLLGSVRITLEKKRQEVCGKEMASCSAGGFKLWT